MKNKYVISRIDQLEKDIATISKVTDPQISSFLSSFLAVYSCGVYEDCIEYLVMERASKSGDSEVQEFVKQSIIKSFRNPNYENIKQLIGKFGSGYLSSLTTQVDNRLSTSIGSIITNKNDVAHAGQYKLALGDFIAYHSEAKKIFEILEKVLNI
jgi:hypothetical protein